MSINVLLSQNPVVPLVQADDPAVAMEVSRALAAEAVEIARAARGIS
ncbi:MAG: hypothetical protein GWP67_09675 [Gammaproteobacteria bacterium]|jgi:2-keto-3-deoxy-6-phosphogluconate aldolase|nr:hypothetical protein [Gammaproteobacteria bacterium]